MPLMIRLMPNLLFILMHCFFTTGTENKTLKTYVFEKRRTILQVIKNKKNFVYYKTKKLMFIKNRTEKRKRHLGVKVEVKKGKKKEKGTNKNERSSCPFAYLVFDIIKIFGRLSNKELLGHVISHNNEFTDLERTTKKKKNWEILFDNDSSITFEKLQVFLKNTKFEWPLTVNSGQIKNQGSIDIPVAPIVYVENCRKLTEEQNAKNKNFKLNIKTINMFVDGLPIANDAIQCVFSSFSDLKSLTKTHFINKIHEWAPSDGIVDWYTFVYNLKEEPSDNIKRFLD